MTETTSAGVAAALGGIAMLLASLGLQHDYLIAAMAGSIIAVLAGAPTTRLRTFAGLITSAILGAYCAPILAVVAADRFPIIGTAREGALPLLCAALTGLAAPTVVPLLLAWIRKKAGVLP